MQNSPDAPGAILVIRLSSLGDVLLSTPLVRLLRKRYPASRIDVVCASAFADVYAFNPHVSHLLRLDKSRSALATILPSALAGIAKSYDLVFDLQHNLRSAVIRRRYGRQVRIVNKYRREKLEMLRSRQAPVMLPHVVDRFLTLEARDERTAETSGLELWLPSDSPECDYAEARIEHRKNLKSRLIVIAPGAQHHTKRWPALRFAELASSLLRRDYEVALIGSQAERELCASIAEQCGTELKNLCGSSLFESAALMDDAALVLSNDSGAMHIAAARRVPVVAIFGSTVPELGFAPYGVPNRIVQTELECRPCTHIGRESCPLGHLRCLRDISVTMVENAVLELLAAR